MYKTSQVTPKDLGKIKVKNQARIREITGEELDPKKAWSIIKNESKNFTNDNPKAKQADELFAELMKANGLIVNRDPVSKSKDDDKERIRIRERERARTIQIMKLKLQIAA
ncbi:hypothetical protein QQ008_07405 [Fulvivirgaceae bacterium BMA10]|uniref:Uncharacterized protein n=1 Tax=Splendidivirga corallicola TaxID=3051826 RepID=A0ABT8KKE2_9BACT|nr:hypothetical protein [Fulvivirgaceae bacterium BMA10]